MIFPLSHQICYPIRAHKFVHFRLRCQRVAVLGKTAPGDVPLYADEASGKVYEAMPCIRRTAACRFLAIFEGIFGANGGSNHENKTWFWENNWGFLGTWGFHQDR